MAPFVTICVTLLLIACTHTQPITSPLRIGMNDWLGYQTFLWAQQRQLIGKDIDLIELPNNTETSRLFHNRALDVACLTLDEVLRLSNRNDDLVIIAILDYSNGADALIAQPGIDSIQALKGKRIGYEKSALGAYMLERVLEKAGLTASQVQALPLAFHQHESFFMQKRLDAVITFEPILTKLVKQNGVKLFDTADIPGEIVDVLVTRTGVIEAHPDRLRQLIGAWFAAAAEITARDTRALEYLAGLLQTDPAALQHSLEGLTLPSKEESRTILLSEAFESAVLRTTHVLTRLGLYHDTLAHIQTKRETIETLY